MSYGPAPSNPPRPPADTGYRKALRVATGIAVVRWFLIVVLAIATVAAPIYQFSTDAGSDFEDAALLIGGGMVLVGVLLILLVWVLFGWFEHVLRVLVAVADHTRP